MERQQSALKVIQVYLFDRFVLLLLSLLLLFVFLPCLEIENHQTRVFSLNVVFLIILVVTLRAVSCECKGWWLWGLFGLGITAVAVRWLSFASGSDSASAISTGLDLVLFSLCSVIILVSVLRAERVTVDKVIGAICVYFLIGLMWALLFSLLEILRPGAFHMPEHALPGGLGVVSPNFDIVQAVYYSFTTITTLGFGDISPAIPAAQALSSLEAATGQLYLAVLIARLVSLNVAYSIRTNGKGM